MIVTYSLLWHLEKKLKDAENEYFSRFDDSLVLLDCKEIGTSTKLMDLDLLELESCLCLGASA